MTPPSSRRRLELVPAGGASVSVLDALAGALGSRLGARAAIGAPLPLDPEWRDAETGRWRSSPVVDALLDRAEAEGGGAWLLAVVDGELCAPERPLVFGEAAVGGGCAVVGLGALEGKKSRRDAEFLDRLVKEAVHEVAHAAGLEHCANPACVMYPSRDIADTDRKGSGFCAACEPRFSHATLDAART